MLRIDHNLKKIKGKVLDLSPSNFKKMIVYFLSFFVITGICLIGFLQIQISHYKLKKIPKNADYLIVLGASVKGTVPSLVLKERIHAAAIYLKMNKRTIAIASGGKGSNEKISEAESIKRELMKRGISPKRILLEDKSRNTYENIKNSKKFIIPTEKKGIIVTNDFHIYRSLMIAKDQGLHLYGLPAKTPISAIPKSYLHEYLALIKYYSIKYIH